MKIERKTVYLAGKVGSGESTIESFADDLEGRGHTVLCKWWEMTPPVKPYLEDVPRNGELARQMIESAIASNVFILFPDDRAMGSVGELCAAIAATEIHDTKKLIIVVNPFLLARQTIFYAHPCVTTTNGVDDIREMPWY